MRGLIFSCGVATACFSSVVQAQTPAPNSSTVEDIIVTAQRRSERLVDVPVSVNSISQAELETKHIETLANITQSVTSLRFEGNVPAFGPTLRGISTLVSGGGVDASVGVYVDGVYLPNTSGMGFSLANISSVQVLKGPQGTLFGRNTTGGAILITTAEPSFEWTGQIKGTYQSFDDRRVEGYVSGPLSSDIAFGVSGYYRLSDGYMVNIANGNKHDLGLKMFNIRPSLFYSNHDNFKLRLIYDHSYSSDITGLGLVNTDGYVIAGTLPGAVVGHKFPYYAVNSPPVNLTKNDAFTGIADLQLSTATSLKSVTSYRTDSNLFVADADMSNLDIFSVEQLVKYKTFSQEFTLAHKAGRLDLVAGANYYNSLANQPYTKISQFGTTAVLEGRRIRTEAIGIFADATYEIADSLFLTAGARFSAEKKRVTADPTPPDQHRWNAVTPRAVIRYQIDSGDNVYLSFSRGFKPGAYNGTPPALVKPEHVTAYEGGYKHSSRLIDFTAAAFYYRYTDFQVSTFDFNANLGVTINAPAERSYGFEAETTLRLTPNWRVSLAGAYLNAKFTDFDNATIQEPNGIGQWVSAPQSASGTIAPRSPKWSGNASTTYELNTSVGKVELNANMSFASKLYNMMNEQFVSPAYAMIGLNASFTPNNGPWKAQFFVTNLTNKHLYSQYQGGPFGTYALFQPPRVFGGSLAYSF
ncbi:MAG: TonB-dependent receptor [Sphingobium sp.]